MVPKEGALKLLGLLSPKEKEVDGLLFPKRSPPKFKELLEVGVVLEKEKRVEELGVVEVVVVPKLLPPKLKGSFGLLLSNEKLFPPPKGLAVLVLVLELVLLEKKSKDPPEVPDVNVLLVELDPKPRLLLLFVDNGVLKLLEENAFPPEVGEEKMLLLVVLLPNVFPKVLLVEVVPKVLGVVLELKLKALLVERGLFWLDPKVLFVENGDEKELLSKVFEEPPKMLLEVLFVPKVLLFVEEVDPKMLFTPPKVLLFVVEVDPKTLLFAPPKVLLFVVEEVDPPKMLLFPPPKVLVSNPPPKGEEMLVFPLPKVLLEVDPKGLLPVLPKVFPVFPKVLPVLPKVLPVLPKVFPVLPKVLPVLPKLSELFVVEENGEEVWPKGLLVLVEPKVLFVGPNGDDGVDAKVLPIDPPVIVPKVLLF